MAITVTDLGERTEPIEQVLERFRTELNGYCYRMLGAMSEAEDAVQETMTKAWRAHDSFEGRSALRTWLYRIATNVCFDMLKSSQRRARPMDLQDSGTTAGPLGPPLPEQVWVLPAPDGKVLPTSSDPADEVIARESVRLAFVAALQLLPPRQRAVLILRDVLRLHAEEVAALLETTVASANSALQRARATLEAARESSVSPRPDVGRPVDQALLDRYVDAFERYDIDLLKQLVHQDAIQSMPPFALWFRGRDQIIDWMLGPGIECQGSRLRVTQANGVTAFGQYRRRPDGTGHDPWALQLHEWIDGRIVEMSFFLQVGELFPLFGLPTQLEAEPAPGS